MIKFEEDLKSCNTSCPDEERCNYNSDTETVHQTLSNQLCIAGSDCNTTQVLLQIVSQLLDMKFVAANKRILILVRIYSQILK